MPNDCVNLSLLLYHCLLILCIIMYKKYVKQFIGILLHIIVTIIINKWYVILIMVNISILLFVVWQEIQFYPV
jgi:hypothetical protein